MMKNEEINLSFNSSMNNNFTLSRAEKEVILTIDEETQEWLAYVSSPYWMRRFERAGWECTKTDYFPDGRVLSKNYKAPKKRVGILKERPKRELTDEERLALRERALKMQESRKNNK
jgi:hypothetical protein